MPKNIYMTWTVYFVLLESGVFVADAVKSESVTEGESVSLNSSFTQIHRDEEIKWKFGDILIAKVKKTKESKFYGDNVEGRFRDRLKLDHQTGSLTIINSRTTDSGLYTVSSSERDTINTINLTVYGVFVADAVKSESVTEGESVSLNSSFTQIHRDEEIQWRFAEFLIAKVKKNKESKFYDTTAAARRFRDRLKLDHQTGSLTIINSRTTDSGLYTVSRDTTINTINLTVYARLPVPVISRDSSQCSSSSSSCSLVCSAVNVSHVTLSWFKGNSVFSSISVSDLSISLSLPLEVEYQDKNTYSCVINNPISHQTRHLNITELCHTCAAVSRTVLISAAAAGSLLIVAAVGIFCICRKHRNTHREETRAEEITDPTFNRRNRNKSRATEEDNVEYTSVPHES